ncbi:MAG: DUF4147 domain-containing protein, partial [Candidatus Acidiferrales bacterium]
MLNLKQSALQIARETLAAIDIPSTMQRKLARSGSTIRVNGAGVDLAKFDRIYAVSIGKAAVGLAHGISETLSPGFG